MSLIKTGIQISRRGFLVSTVLFTVFLASYSIFSFLLTKYTGPLSELQLALRACFNFVIAISLVASSFFIGRPFKSQYIFISLTSILIMTALAPFVLNSAAMLGITIATGFFFGTGLLSFLTYFWNLTVPEERGRIAGLIGFIALPLYSVANILIATMNTLGTVVATTLLGLATSLTFLLRPRESTLASKENKGGNYAEKRTIMLYTIPWIVFSFINVTLARTASLSIVSGVPSSFYLTLILYQTGGVVLGALLGGIAADFFGRKELLISSLTLYGISATLVGLFANNEILILAYVVNGLTWGVLFILYTMVVWGDLAAPQNCTQIYSIGLSVYYTSVGVGLMTQVSIPVLASSLVSCMMVFLANIPIAYAPELAPPDFLERIKLKLHIKRAKKIRQD